MKRSLLAVLVGGLLVCGSAVAHPTDTPFASRGECEAALAEANNDDGDFLLSIGEFDTRGDANKWFHDHFQCEQQGDAWYIVFIPDA